MTVQEKISQLHELFAGAPEVGRADLRIVLGRLASDASKAPPPVQSAGRAGSRLGKVSELTIIVPFAPGGAQRLRSFLQLFGGNWDTPFGRGFIHIGVSVFSDSEQAWRQTMDRARRQYEGFPGLRVLLTQDFGAQPGDLNTPGYRDSIGQPPSRAACRPAARPGPAGQSRRVHPRLPREVGVPHP